MRTGTAHPRRSWTLAALCLLLAGCPAEAPDASETGGENDDAGDESGETGDPVAAGDACDGTALTVEAPSSLAASLRHATASPLAEVCDIDGPAVFVRVRVPARADLSIVARGRGFVPKLALTRTGCVSASDDPNRLLACGELVPVNLLDIGPNVELLAIVGIDADDPALALEPSDPEQDPLDFELEMQLRAVLDEGQRCGPSYGRCEDGTVCLSVVESGIESLRCVRPPADSCVAPGLLELPEPGEQLSFTIPPDEPHSDAHGHACTGWRRPERVDRLSLPSSLAPGTRLHVRADDPRVGLALRASDCDPAHALACAAAGGPSETTLAWTVSADDPLLFIELPRPDLDTDPVGPIHIELELLPP